MNRTVRQMIVFTFGAAIASAVLLWLTLPSASFIEGVLREQPRTMLEISDAMYWRTLNQRLRSVDVSYQYVNGPAAAQSWFEEQRQLGRQSLLDSIVWYGSASRQESVVAINRIRAESLSDVFTFRNSTDGFLIFLDQTGAIVGWVRMNGK